jgi:hypothetical protein
MPIWYKAAEANANMVQSQIEGGVNTKEIKEGATLTIKTEHRVYTLEKRPDGFYISGHPKYCPGPTMVTIVGSTWGGTMLKSGFIGRGMLLEFTLPDKKEPITTSVIEEITEMPAKK